MKNFMSNILGGVLFAAFFMIIGREICRSICSNCSNKIGNYPSDFKSMNLRKKAWDLHSKLVRLKNADWKGYVRCFTCSAVKKWKEMDAGHCIHKDSLDFDDMNIRPQCSACNRYNSGRREVFAYKLIKEYGLKAYEDMIQRGNRTRKFNQKELKNLIDKYQKELMEKIKN